MIVRTFNIGFTLLTDTYVYNMALLIETCSEDLHNLFILNDSNFMLINSKSYFKGIKDNKKSQLFLTT